MYMDNDNKSLYEELSKLKKEFEEFKNLYYKDNYSNLQVFNKNTQFNGKLIIPIIDSATLPSIKANQLALWHDSGSNEWWLLYSGFTDDNTVKVQLTAA